MKVGPTRRCWLDERGHGLSFSASRASLDDVVDALVELFERLQWEDSAEIAPANLARQRRLPVREQDLIILIRPWNGRKSRDIDDRRRHACGGSSSRVRLERFGKSGSLRRRRSHRGGAWSLRCTTQAGQLSEGGEGRRRGRTARSKGLQLACVLGNPFRSSHRAQSVAKHPLCLLGSHLAKESRAASLEQLEQDVVLLRRPKCAAQAREIWRVLSGESQAPVMPQSWSTR